MNITDFLLARIQEDEARANYYRALALGTTRVLAECAAKRAIVERCYGDHEDAMASNNDSTEAASEVLYALASVYKDHPDYRQEWAS